jgi:hypothetical protein
VTAEKPTLFVIASDPAKSPAICGMAIYFYYGIVDTVYDRALAVSKASKSALLLFNSAQIVELNNSVSQKYK